MSTVIHIGTQGSPLALAQAATLNHRLVAFGQAEADAFEEARTAGRVDLAVYMR